MIAGVREWFGNLLGSGQASDDDEEPPSEAVAHFLNGFSIPFISAILNPGLGGPALVAQQTVISDEIKDFLAAKLDQIAELKEEIVELKQEIAELEAALEAALEEAAAAQAALGAAQAQAAAGQAQS